MQPHFPNIDDLFINAYKCNEKYQTVLFELEGTDTLGPGGTCMDIWIRLAEPQPPKKEKKKDTPILSTIGIHVTSIAKTSFKHTNLLWLTRSNGIYRHCRKRLHRNHNETICTFLRICRKVIIHKLILKIGFP